MFLPGTPRDLQMASGVTMRFNVRKALILTALVAAVLAMLSKVVASTDAARPLLLFAFLFVAAIAWVYEFARTK
ncbi:hypothetical protein [Lacipirellula limnantheis]|nr:hypothetical protein [Lacipirellula limnantheis]